MRAPSDKCHIFVVLLREYHDQWYRMSFSNQGKANVDIFYQNCYTKNLLHSTVMLLLNEACG